MPSSRAESGRSRPPPAASSAARDLSRTVVPRPVPADAALDHPHLLFNRDLSWIDFNSRVLAQAERESVPLLERVRFLAIAEDNLDRFLRTRLGALKRQQRSGIVDISPDDRTPAEQIRLVQDAVGAMRRAMSALWREELAPRLEQAGIRMLGYEDLTAAERDGMDRLFHSSIYPVLTPLAVDPRHPFPFISNLSLSLAVLTRHPGRATPGFVRIKVPAARGRWVPVGDDRRRFLPIETLIARHAGAVFPGLTIDGIYAFRVTRSADVARGEDEVEDLIQVVADELRERRFAPVIRLEVASDMSADVVSLLCRELDIEAEDAIAVEGPLALCDLTAIADLDIPALRYAAWEPRVPPRLVSRPPEAPLDIFAALRAADILIHHPYESFSASVQHFVECAAADPQVLSIKQTLYRTGEHSPIVRSLIRAADAGKQVAALVEITASFDEQRNIEWARMLESHGVHVTHGVAGLKTHAKVTLVVREEEDGIRTYCHIGTGNYHSRTARLYTDLGLLTADPAIGMDLVDLFHHITGQSPGHAYDQLVVAPMSMRDRFKGLIEREIRHHLEGRPARITAKMNALDDVGMIRTLYRASRAGVATDLIVRGHCRLRPGLPGFSDNIRVISIVGRFLEHDRIYRFENGGDPELYIGSADWRRRNLEERIEVVVPVAAPDAAERLSAILDAALTDNATAWDLHADGRYALRAPPPDQPPQGFQDTLMGRVADGEGGPARLRADPGGIVDG